jgi:hypothetical protein
VIDVLKGSADDLVGLEEEGSQKKVIGARIHDREKTEGPRREMRGLECGMPPITAVGNHASARMRLGIVATRADGARLFQLYGQAVEPGSC